MTSEKAQYGSPGLEAIHSEMRRQSADAGASFRSTAEIGRTVAESARRTGRLLLLGMGGSHAINRTAEVLYRRAGVDCSAMPVSEHLYAPLPPGPRTVLITSQSGESAEVVRLLDMPNAGEERFGITLNPDGTLGSKIPSAVGIGGMEKAFAATRSYTVTLALHARVVHELGSDQQDAISVAERPPRPDIAAAADLLVQKRAAVFSARGALQGIAEAGALGLMELARIPCFALEGGQLRHGPVEALGPDLGVVLVRALGAAPELTTRMAEFCVEANCPPVVIDCSGSDAVPGSVTVPLPPAADLAAAFSILIAVQMLMVEVAKRTVTDPGTPVRASKITREE